MPLRIRVKRYDIIDLRASLMTVPRDDPRIKAYWDFICNIRELFGLYDQRESATVSVPDWAVPILELHTLLEGRMSIHNQLVQVTDQ